MQDEQPNGGLGEAVYEYVNDYSGLAPAFGELALLYNQARRAYHSSTTER
jgi:hypothetical protein